MRRRRPQLRGIERIDVIPLSGRRPMKRFDVILLIGQLAERQLRARCNRADQAQEDPDLDQ
jgi:hypothetical protein